MKKQPNIRYEDGVAYIGPGLMIACFTTAEQVLDGSLPRPNRNDARALAIAVKALSESQVRLELAVSKLVEALDDLGFDTNDPVSGADTVDVVCEHLPRLRKALVTSCE